MLNDPHVTTAQVLKVIFPQTSAGIAATHAYVQRLFAWPKVTQNDFNASVSIIRQQSVAEGQRLWYCSTCGAYARLPSIRARTLVVDGRHDIIEPPGNSHIIANRIPQASLTLFAGAGHAFLFQANAAVAARVNRFLG